MLLSLVSVKGIEPFILHLTCIDKSDALRGDFYILRWYLI